MATFGCYKGNMHIAENTKEEFTTNVLKLLNYGGMVQFDEISIGGYKIALIKPVELNQYGEACFDYNYFEDNFHETARYNAERAHLFTAAIGCDDFCYVITAVHFLYGLYDNSYGCVEINDDIVNGYIYIGWINHILGTNYSLKKFFQLWEQFESYCLYELNEFEEHGREEYRDERYRDVPHWFDEAGLVPNSLYWALGSTHFADIYYIKEGTSSFREDEIVPGSYPESVYKCKILLKQYFSNDAYAESKKTKRIWQLVKSKRKTRKEIRQYGLQELAQISLRLPARVIVYLTCEIIGQPFWSIWKQIREDAYKDEKMPQYAPDELIAQRKAVIEKPIAPVKTSDFLQNHSSITVGELPDEWKGKPDYCLSDDDRLFWWDGSEEVIISKKTEKWLSDLAKRYRQLLKKHAHDNPSQNDLLKELASTLADIDNYYERVYAFQNMFYEFLMNAQDKRYFAAVKLMQELAKENLETGRIIKKANPHGWDITHKNITHNEGRMTMKRYLSVMANPNLRKKYFRF